MSQVFGACQTVFLLGDFLRWVAAALLITLGFVGSGSLMFVMIPQFVHLGVANTLAKDGSVCAGDWGQQIEHWDLHRVTSPGAFKPPWNGILYWKGVEAEWSSSAIALLRVWLAVNHMAHRWCQKLAHPPISDLHYQTLHMLRSQIQLHWGRGCHVSIFTAWSILLQPEVLQCIVPSPSP